VIRPTTSVPPAPPPSPQRRPRAADPLLGYRTTTRSGFPDRVVVCSPLCHCSVSRLSRLRPQIAAIQRWSASLTNARHRSTRMLHPVVVYSVDIYPELSHRRCKKTAALQNYPSINSVCTHQHQNSYNVKIPKLHQSLLDVVCRNDDDYNVMHALRDDRNHSCTLSRSGAGNTSRNTREYSIKSTERSVHPARRST
jgi:hypothetical protein